MMSLYIFSLSSLEDRLIFFNKSIGININRRDFYRDIINVLFQ